MARKAGKTFKCQSSECGALQALPPNTYQAVSCIVCGHKHAVVKGKGEEPEVVSYFHQERPATSSN